MSMKEANYNDILNYCIEQKENDKRLADLTQKEYAIWCWGYGYSLYVNKPMFTNGFIIGFSIIISFLLGFLLAIKLNGLI